MAGIFMEKREIFVDFNNPSNLGHALNLYYGGWEVCCAGHKFGPAVRQHYLLHYVTAGKGRLWINNKCYEINQNTIFLIVPGVVATYQADRESPWEYCWICIDGYEVETILNNCGFSKENILFYDKSGVVQEVLLKFIFSFEKNKHNEYKLLSQLYDFFAQMKKLWKKDNIKSIYVEKAIDFIYKNFGDGISVNDIAAYLKIDRTYLYRLFKKECGISPQKYLLDFRLKTAVNKLESSDKSIAEIAEYCGFSDISAFCHQFKKVYNDTPLNYRRDPQRVAIEKNKPDR